MTFNRESTQWSTARRITVRGPFLCSVAEIARFGRSVAAKTRGDMFWRKGLSIERCAFPQRNSKRSAEHAPLSSFAQASLLPGDRSFPSAVSSLLISPQQDTSWVYFAKTNRRY